MIDKLVDLFEYTHHYNQKIIGLIKDHMPKLDDRIIELISHTINAQQIWNARILGEKTFEVWQINQLEELEEIDHQNFLTSIRIVQNFNLDNRIGYQNSRGTKFENSVFEMLFHAINHSTYHRGQINSLLKQNGVEPILTDYIFYKR